MVKVKCNLEKCNKRVSDLLPQLFCKCKKIFCKNHIFFTEHDCNFNFYEENKIKIKSENKKIFKEKIIKI